MYEKLKYVFFSFNPTLGSFLMASWDRESLPVVFCAKTGKLLLTLNEGKEPVLSQDSKMVAAIGRSDNHQLLIYEMSGNGNIFAQMTPQSEERTAYAVFGRMLPDGEVNVRVITSIHSKLFLREALCDSEGGDLTLKE